MFGMKSKAEKEKELNEKVERELRSRKSKEEAEKKLEEYNKKFKKGATFKYLELDAMLRGFYISGGYWGNSSYHVAIDVVHIKHGEILPLEIDVELLEALIKL